MASPPDYGLNLAIIGAQLLACASFLSLMYLIIFFCAHPFIPKSWWAQSYSDWQLPVTSSGRDHGVQVASRSFFSSTYTRSKSREKKQGYRTLPLLINTWVPKDIAIKCEGLFSAITAGIHGFASQTFSKSKAHAVFTPVPSRARHRKSLQVLSLWQCLQTALSRPLQWLRACVEDLRLDEEIPFEDHYRDWIVLPVSSDSTSDTQDHESSTQDSNSGPGSYYCEEEYYPHSPMLEQVFVRAAPSPSPSPSPIPLAGLGLSPTPPLFPIDDLWLNDEESDKEDRILELVASAANERREKLYSIPLLSHASRGPQTDKKVRPTQGDWVLIREMDPNRPEIASQVSQVSQMALDSDSATDITESEESMSIELESGLSVVNNADALSVGSPQLGIQSLASSSRDDFGIPTISLTGYHSRSETHPLSPWLFSGGDDTNSIDYHQDSDMMSSNDWVVEDLFLSLPEYDTNTSGLHFGFELADATRESTQYFASTADVSALHMAVQEDAELLHAIWHDGRDERMYGIPLEWVNNDVVTGESLQPTQTSSFIQRHMFRQSLLDEGLLLVSPALVSENDDTTTAQNIAHLDCSTGQNESLPCLTTSQVFSVDDGATQEEGEGRPKLKRRRGHGLSNAEALSELPVVAKRVRSFQGDEEMNPGTHSSDLETIDTSNSILERGTAMDIDGSTDYPITTNDEDTSLSAHTNDGETFPSDSDKCPHCALYFSSRAILNNHIRRKHARRFECGSCEWRFNLKADLHRHQRCVHAQGAESWTCSREPCIAPGKVFTRKDNFKRHVMRCKRNDTADKS